MNNSPSKALSYVVIGSFDDLRNLKKMNAPVWPIVKTATPGDHVFVFVQQKGIVATAVVGTLPTKGANTGWPDRYASSLEDITILHPFISEKELLKLFPDWGWLNYPRKFTTIPPKGDIKLFELASTRCKRQSSVILPDIDFDQIEVTEGKQKLRLHLSRERNGSIRKLKVQEYLSRNRHLQCEACGFDFEAVYGDRGERFCEVHHLVPLADLTAKRQTTLKELAIVCSNCHRMIHRGKIITLSALKSLIQKNGRHGS